MTTRPSRLPTTVVTHRLVLRAPVVADAEVIFHSYAKDPVVARFMVWAPHAALLTTVGFIEASIALFADGDRMPYVIARREEPATPIGMLEARFDGHGIELGYVLTRAAWGQGLMPEAVAALADTALEEAGFFRVQAFCDVDNRRSQRTLEKAGFAREGRLERFVVHPNLGDEPRDCFVYAKCR